MPLYPLVQWNGSYRLKVYVPAKVRTSLGISGNYYDKRFKTKKEAKEAELQILTDINTIQKGEALPHQAMILCRYYLLIVLDQLPILIIRVINQNISFITQ